MTRLLLAGWLGLGSLASAATPTQALGPRDLLEEDAYPCQDPRTGKAFADWGHLCNKKSKVSYAGTFRCAGRRVEVFTYVHFFQNFAGSGTVHGGQNVAFFVNDRWHAEIGLDTPPFYTLRVNARGLGVFRVEGADRRDDGKTSERVELCGPQGVVKGFFLEGGYVGQPSWATP